MDITGKNETASAPGQYGHEPYSLVLGSVRRRRHLNESQRGELDIFWREFRVATTRKPIQT